MIGFELPAEDIDAVTRVVRALGSHRYVAGRLHMVHAFAFASAYEGTANEALREHRFDDALSNLQAVEAQTQKVARDVGN